MIPNIPIPPIRIGTLEFHAFGILMALGFLLAAHTGSRRAARTGLRQDVVYDATILCVVFGLIGAHVFHMLFYDPARLWKDPKSIVQIWSGLSSWGGLVGSGLAVWAYFRYRKLNVLAYADMAMFALLPAWTLGRIGCFTAHDHLGKMTTFFLAIHFPGGSRHDLGFYEAIACGLLSGVVYYMGRKNKIDDPPAGTIFATMLVCYALIRFGLDFLRATDLPGSDVRYQGLTPAQYSCMASLCFGLYLLFRIRQSRGNASNKAPST